ncbi:MAG: GNAT family N-acetyltransferase [Chitinophagales bacterium]|nr:GNAT family N-acetyltransferase [Chitinophagales bacterium]
MIRLRKIEARDLADYKYWKKPIHAYHKFNGPYFKRQSEEEIKEEITNLKRAFEQGNLNPLPQKRIITNVENELIGEVSWYWKSKETDWLEIGIVIFNDKFWRKGIGYEALKLWIEEVFNDRKEIVRIGLTTWSGNASMMKLAEKIGMKKEAEYQKARIVDGVYYDSVSYGVLREEWYNRTIHHEEQELHKLTQSFFDIFTNKDGQIPDWNRIYEICIPESMIIKKDGTIQEVYDLDSFIRPRRTILSDGTLKEFEEEEVKQETKVIGNIAQRVSLYRKTGIFNGKQFEQYGNKLFQFLKVDGQWKISSVIWEDKIESD